MLSQADIFRMSGWRRIRLTDYAARMGKMCKSSNLQKLKERDSLGNGSVEGGTLLLWILNKYNAGCGQVSVDKQ